MSFRKILYFRGDYKHWELLGSNILECEVKWALESITMNKASRGDGIPAEIFKY